MMHADNLATKTAQQLLDYLHSRQTEMRSLLEKLVLAESPSTVPAAQQEVLALLQKALEQRAYRVRRIRGRQTGGHLLAVPSTRQRNIFGDRSFPQPIQLLLGHSDTVWSLGTLKKMPLSLRQGKMYGPGIYDMKAGLVQTLFALEAIAANGFFPQVIPVILLAGAGQYHDILTMSDAGADRIFDFVDVGLPSSVCPPEKFRPYLRQLLAAIAGEKPDVVVAEIGASPFEPYNGAVVLEEMKEQICCTVLCASDPYAVLGATQCFDLTPDLVTGIATSTTAGIELVEKLTGIKALSLSDRESISKLMDILKEKLSPFSLID
jgi:hypothetical protein